MKRRGQNLQELGVEGGRPEGLELCSFPLSPLGPSSFLAEGLTDWRGVGFCGLGVGTGRMTRGFSLHCTPKSSGSTTSTH